MKEEESEGSSKRRKGVLQDAGKGATRAGGWATGPRTHSLGQRAGMVAAPGKEETEQSIVQRGSHVRVCRRI